MKYNHPEYNFYATKVVEFGEWKNLLPFEYVLYEGDQSCFQIEEAHESYEIAISGSAGKLSGTGELVFDNSCESIIGFYHDDELIIMIHLKTGIIEACGNF